jgi:hypothetical protein
MKKALKIIGGVLFGLFALATVLQLPIALSRLSHAETQNMSFAIGYLAGTCMGILLWGGLSFFLFRSAFKVNANSNS